MRGKRFAGSIAAMAGLFLALTCLAAEHPGSAVEHPGKAVESEKPKVIMARMVKQFIKSHVNSVATKGVFVVRDEKLNKEWRLKLDKIHDPVRMFEKEGKTIYFTCSDFRSADSKDILDVDFWLVPKGDGLEVIDTKIHKVNGEPRYSYEGTEIKEIR